MFWHLPYSSAAQALRDTSNRPAVIHLYNARTTTRDNIHTTPIRPAMLPSSVFMHPIDFRSRTSTHRLQPGWRLRHFTHASARARLVLIRPRGHNRARTRSVSQGLDWWTSCHCGVSGLECMWNSHYPLPRSLHPRLYDRRPPASSPICVPSLQYPTPLAAVLISGPTRISVPKNVGLSQPRVRTSRSEFFFSFSVYVAAVLRVRLATEKGYEPSCARTFPAISHWASAAARCPPRRLRPLYGEHDRRAAGGVSLTRRMLALGPVPVRIRVLHALSSRRAAHGLDDGARSPPRRFGLHRRLYASLSPSILSSMHCRSALNGRLPPNLRLIRAHWLSTLGLLPVTPSSAYLFASQCINQRTGPLRKIDTARGHWVRLRPRIDIGVGGAASCGHGLGDVGEHDGAGKHGEREAQEGGKDG
ncbi:hypothetical protein C8R45DRAFT_1164693 [Mycena sanguinolenta]|nr:hypothetical protein C8R45DRAFT_1164693 [Mycena sanguinolenta]